MLSCHDIARHLEVQARDRGPEPGDHSRCPRRTRMIRSALLVIAATAAAASAISDTTLAQQTPAPVTGQAPAPGRGGVPVQGAEEDIPLVARFDRNGDKRLDHG